jgi:peptidoglycan/xylan/chitin deacetylase (PgdA/CDA1 family)
MEARRAPRRHDAERTAYHPFIRSNEIAMTRLLSLLFHDVYRRDPLGSGFAGPTADRYKLTLTEFDMQLAGLARVRQDKPVLISELEQTSQAMPLVITADDGGVSYYTMIASRLEARGWRGHCFVTTGYIGQAGFLNTSHIRSLHKRGHVIGTHSVSHPARFANCDWDEMVREWSDSRKTLQDILGADVTVASVPGGYFSRRVAHAAEAAGLTTLFTSEPETGVRTIGACRVIGRFTVRHGCARDFCARIVTAESSLRTREWAVWNAKKAVKGVLGAGYPRVTRWISHVAR